MPVIATNVLPELDFKLYRSIPVGSLPDPNWAATLTLPGDSVSIIEHFPSKHGFMFTLILKDAGGNLVAPGSMTYSPRYYAVLNDGTDDIMLRGADRPDSVPYDAIVEDTIGFGRYAIGIDAVANIPTIPAVATVEIWVKEI